LTGFTGFTGFLYKRKKWEENHAYFLINPVSLVNPVKGSFFMVFTRAFKLEVPYALRPIP
jgi:hypothetical protein